jgi:hypothetical protein
VNGSPKAWIVRVGSCAKAALVPKAAVSTEPMMIALSIVLPFKVFKVAELAAARKDTCGQNPRYRRIRAGRANCCFAVLMVFRLKHACDYIGTRKNAALRQNRSGDMEL